MAFVSTATNLTPEDTNDRPDIYVYDLNSESIELLSRTPSGKAGNGVSSRPAISEDGRFVAFDSTASDLVCTRRCASRDQDQNLVSDVFLLDRNRGRIRRLSQELTGQPWWEPSVGPALDAAGRLVTFSSRHAGNSGDARADFDLFVVNLPRENEVPGDGGSRSPLDMGQHPHFEDDCLRCGSTGRLTGAHWTPFQIFSKGSGGSSKPVDVVKSSGNLVPTGERLARASRLTATKTA